MNNKMLNKEALKAWILSKMVTLTNNLLATTPGVSAMDAAQGPVIQGQIDRINSNFGGLSFGMTEDGQPGYRKPGADTVHPFSHIFDAHECVNIYSNKRNNSGTALHTLPTITLSKKYKLVVAVVIGTLDVTTATTVISTNAANYKVIINNSQIGRLPMTQSASAIVITDNNVGDTISLKASAYSQEFVLGWE